MPKNDEEDLFQTNLWRETSFAYHLIKQAVNPVLSLEDSIKNWKTIANDLSENPRKRGMQIQKMYRKPIKIENKCLS